MKRNIFLPLILFLCCNTILLAQTGGLKADLLKLKAASDSTVRSRPVEKLYLQFDKPYYALGDTIWFKAYLLNDYLTASDKSRIINIDIADDSNKVIKQYRLPVSNGLSWGNISLNEKEGFATGTYTIRAYTNWMRNFGDSYFFYKSFYVANVTENNWLVNRLFKDSLVNGSNMAEVKLQFSDMDKKLFMVEPLTLQVSNGNKTLYRQKLQTDLSGMIAVNFAIPEKANSLTIIAESEKKNKRAVIPIVLNRPENTDLQFLPEGGNLVAGLPAHVAFKAIGEDGKGVQISGIITDHNQQQVARFQSLHNGMGDFDLIVNESETYTAKVTFPNGIKKDYLIPAVKSSGTVLNIKNPFEVDSLEVSVFATSDIVKSGESYFLVGKARGVVCYAAVFNFNSGSFIRRKIAKSLFPTGIAHFTVMTTKNQPLNERLVFIDHHDNLNITVSADKTIYTSRDSVTLHIKVTDQNENPVSGNFSLAVTDDATVKTDSLAGENVISRMLLTSGLKGYIEGPGYYLSSKTKESCQALDNLLLTQGWVGYEWQQVFYPTSITYLPETDFTVKGGVTNVFNKPVKDTHVLLFSKSPSILMDTITDKEGKFIFDRFPRVDTPIFVLKAVNKNGKSFNVRINIDEIKPHDFIKPFTPLAAPWYVNSDGTLINYAKSSTLAKQQKDFPIDGHILKEVKITAKKIVQGSKNLNGPGEADIVLDEKDLEAAGKKTFLQLLQEKVPGFREGILLIGQRAGPVIPPKVIEDRKLFSFLIEEMPHAYRLDQFWYFIKDKPVKLIIDGIPIYKILTANADFAFDDISDYLKSHSAEDIKGIEVMSSAKYAGTYVPTEYAMLIDQSDIAFVEITTRSGGGPDISNIPGMYLYKPSPITRPKQFYKPKYAIKDTTRNSPDLRSTIDWEPNITTDANGKATVSFFIADKASTYTLIMEGTDLNGNLGYKWGKITIKALGEKQP